MQFRRKTQFLTPFLLSELPKNAYKLTSPLPKRQFATSIALSFADPSKTPWLHHQILWHTAGGKLTLS